MIAATTTSPTEGVSPWWALILPLVGVVLGSGGTWLVGIYGSRTARQHAERDRLLDAGLELLDALASLAVAPPVQAGGLGDQYASLVTLTPAQEAARAARASAQTRVRVARSRVMLLGSDALAPLAEQVALSGDGSVHAFEAQLRSETKRDRG